MKIVLMLIIFGGFTYIGIQIKVCLRYKKDLYAGLVSFCEGYKQEVDFLKSDVKAIATKCASQNEQLNKVVEEYFNTKNISYSIIGEQEKKQIIEFMDGLGKQDVEGEIKYADFYKNQFNVRYEKHKENYSKFGGFSVKMSIILGLLFCILLA